MSSDWKQVDTPPPLDSGEVHLWASIWPGPQVCATVCPASRPVEQLHASRRRAGRVQEHFSVGRACLRILLADAVGLDPHSLPITTGVHGKPQLSHRNGARIAFNVAHSKDTILIALTRTGHVGVDVEYFDRATDIMEVAHHNFTASESRTLAAIADPQIRIETFYRYWTRKEAVLKADGRGLIASLSSFDIAFESVNLHPVRMTESPDDPGKLFFVSDLSLGIEAAAGAIALGSRDCPVRQLIFPHRPW